MSSLLSRGSYWLSWGAGRNLGLRLKRPSVYAQNLKLSGWKTIVVEWEKGEALTPLR